MVKGIIVLLLGITGIVVSNHLQPKELSSLDLSLRRMVEDAKKIENDSQFVKTQVFVSDLSEVDVNYLNKNNLLLFRDSTNCVHVVPEMYTGFYGDYYTVGHIYFNTDTTGSINYYPYY